MDFSLLIGGEEIRHDSFQAESLFYPGYHCPVTSAGPLDVARAIGSARKAGRSSLPERAACLQKAAGIFSYNQEHLEHTVKMTGMPLRLVKDLYDQIPTFISQVAQTQQQRYTRTRKPAPLDLEVINPGLFKVLVPAEGFCYAMTPGNDPRAAALLAANLGCLGIPFILRASARDAAAALTLKALIESGFDPDFCSLIYFDRASPETPGLHFRLVDASSVVWSFGPSAIVDPTQRFELNARRAVLDLDNQEFQGITQEDLETALSEKNPAQIFRLMRIEPELTDHFAGKIVIRHESGNCALIATGHLDDPMSEVLYQSTGYPAVCMAARSAMVVDSPGWIEETVEFYSSLKTGDPLDPDTQVGYIPSRDLDVMYGLLRLNASRLAAYGGKRISPIQAAPLVVAAQEDLPDFFAREIPTYVLAVRECSSINEAVDQINRYTTSEPRLAVSLLNLPENLRLEAIKDLRAHTILIDLPTTTLMPAFHEGNDYLIQLTQGKLLVIGE